MRNSWTNSSSVNRMNSSQYKQFKKAYATFVKKYNTQLNKKGQMAYALPSENQFLQLYKARKDFEISTGKMSKNISNKIVTDLTYERKRANDSELFRDLKKMGYTDMNFEEFRKMSREEIFNDTKLSSGIQKLFSNINRDMTTQGYTKSDISQWIGALYFGSE